MKKKSLLLIVLAFFACPILFGQVIKSVHVTTPGTLQSLLTPEELSTVTYRMLTGNINGDDFATMNILMTSLNIIDMIDAITVESNIPSDAFSGKNSLNAVYLPNSITSIGDRAFQGCNFLNNVLFPPDLVSIGNNAFQSTSITSANFPLSLVSIGDQAFFGSYFLTDFCSPPR